MKCQSNKGVPPLPQQKLNVIDSIGRGRSLGYKLFITWPVMLIHPLPLLVWSNQACVKARCTPATEHLLILRRDFEAACIVFAWLWVNQMPIILRTVRVIHQHDGESSLKGTPPPATPTQKQRKILNLFISWGRGCGAKGPSSNLWGN